MRELRVPVWATILVGWSAIASCGGDARKAAPAPDFELIAYQGHETLGGERVKLSEILGKLRRPVVLNFWAAQCPPCRVEMKEFQQVHQTHGDRLLVLGVDMGPFTNLGTAEEARQLLQELQVSYPVGIAAGESVVRDYKILGLPATFFLKPGGEIQRTWTGVLDRDKLTELVAELLTASDSR